MRFLFLLFFRCLFLLFAASIFNFSFPSLNSFMATAKGEWTNNWTVPPFHGLLVFLSSHLIIYHWDWFLLFPIFHLSPFHSFFSHFPFDAWRWFVDIVGFNSNKTPFLELDGEKLSSSSMISPTITIRENKVITLRCVVNGLSPSPASINWFISNVNVTDSSQLLINYSANNDSYDTQSLLTLQVNRDFHAQKLDCVAHHVSWSKPILSTATFNVLCKYRTLHKEFICMLLRMFQSTDHATNCSLSLLSLFHFISLFILYHSVYPSFRSLTGAKSLPLFAFVCQRKDVQRSFQPIESIIPYLEKCVVLAWKKKSVPHVSSSPWSVRESMCERVRDEQGQGEEVVENTSRVRVVCSLVSCTRPERSYHDFCLLVSFRIM